MKCLLTVTIFLYISCTVSCDVIYTKATSPAGATFNNYIEINGHSRHDRKAVKERRGIANSLIKFINKHKDELNDNKKPFKIYIGQDPNMTAEELKEELHEEKTMGLSGQIRCNNSSGTFQPPTDVTLPHTVDLNQTGYVTEVQNQGQCGACWAFVAAASMEGQYKRVSGKLIKLSEQNLIDCSTKQGNNGCHGGQTCKALEYATTIPGVATSDSYPYKKHQHRCHYNQSTPATPVKGYLDIPEGDEEALKAAVALTGPVAASFDGESENFKHYKGGIYSNPSCRKDTHDHAVTVIGYGTENGKDYWLIKNSWGKKWGDNGFGKVLRNHNECGIASSASFPVFDTNEDGTPKLSGPWIKY